MAERQMLDVAPFLSFSPAPITNVVKRTFNVQTLRFDSLCYARSYGVGLRAGVGRGLAVGIGRAEGVGVAVGVAVAVGVGLGVPQGCRM